MQIDEVRIYQVLLPLSVPFPHSLSKRSAGYSIVAEIISQRGRIRGYGEGAPRSYVTGESQESASRTIARLTQEPTFPWELTDVSQIWDFVDSLPDEKKHNSAICALENALLDALGRYQERYVLDYFPKDFYVDTFSYGVGLPLTDKRSMQIGYDIIRDTGIRKLKLKLGRDFIQNKQILKSIHALFGGECDLKVDINCVWNSEMTMRHIPLFQKYRVRVVEQPVTPQDMEIVEIADLMKSAGIVLMADESACTLADVKRLSQEGFYKMVNIRLSKCGGFRKSFRIIDYIRQNSVTFQIGCHVGESGLLSAAGRIICHLCNDAVYYDGSYDELLLKENITLENVSFGPGGKAYPLSGPGLGVNVNHQRLRRLSDNAPIVTLRCP